jgi:AcrR family transcriptional regulator
VNIELIGSTGQYEAVGRRRQFAREDVLAKAMPLFWRHGFSGTALQDLEKVTGVNKSGLYAEFEDKEDLFLASLRYYYDKRGAIEHLAVVPLGWRNIENFFRFVLKPCDAGKGCLGVTALAELQELSAAGRKVVAEGRVTLKRAFARNVAAENPQAAAELAEVLATFFAGLCVEQNLNAPRARVTRNVDVFLRALHATARRRR